MAATKKMTCAMQKSKMAVMMRGPLKLVREDLLFFAQFIEREMKFQRVICHGQAASAGDGAHRHV